MSDTLSLDLVTRRTYLANYGAARGLSSRIRENTSSLAELAALDEMETTYFLTSDRHSGFVVSNGHISGLFSTVKGRGDFLVSMAIRAGGRRLDCLDGYLTDFCGRHGFTVVDRSANWSEGEPDVVIMAR